MNRVVKKIKKKLKEIENDNKVIKDLIPIALMYRMFLSHNYYIYIYYGTFKKG